jgi:SAM-dependent methyltransferase
MGLTFPVVDSLIREHTYRPLAGEILLIGRQTIYFTPADILMLLREHRVDVDDIFEHDIEIDRSTVDRLAQFASLDLISDRALFRLLGVPKVLALDHSGYESADIIFDISKPVPSDLRNIADFIVDGSTLDNVFDPATVIRNFAEMLRPGGRILTFNMYSNHREPYAMMPPLWFFDYFVANGFVDCKVYILVATTPGNTFTIDIEALLDPARHVGAFASPYEMSTLVLAEKGESSTSNVNPIQQHYRSNAEWARHREALRRLKAHPRPHVARSRGDIVFFDVTGGHLLMDTKYIARDPLTEIRRLYPHCR